MKEKFYIGLVIFAVSEEDIPKSGEKIQLNPIQNSKDPNAYGYTKNGRDMYILANPEYIKQVNNNTNNKYDIQPNSYLMGEFPQGCKAVVLNEETSFDTGNNAMRCKILEVEKEPVKVSTGKNSATLDELEVPFTGNQSDYPSKANLWDKILNKSLDDSKLLIKKEGKIKLFYDGAPIGECTDKTIKSAFKNVDKDISCRFIATKSGKMLVAVNKTDLEVTIDFDKDLEVAKNAGVDEDEAKKLIDLMLYYNLHPDTISEVISSWWTISWPEDMKSEIPTIDKFVTEVNGKVNYNYVDYQSKASIANIIETVLSGDAIRFIGDKSAGKDTVVRLIATILRAPHHNIECSGTKTEEDLVGRDTVKDGNVEFEERRLCKYVRNGGILECGEMNLLRANVAAGVFNDLAEYSTKTLEINGETVNANKNFVLIATQNDNDEEGANNQHGGLDTRFANFFFELPTSIEEILMKKVPNANPEEVKMLDKLFNDLKAIIYAPGEVLSTNFLATRGFIRVLDVRPTDHRSFRTRCEVYLTGQDTKEKDYKEVVREALDTLGIVEEE